MVEPTGYTALDLIGFTDRGDYDPSAYYVKNDLVHDGVDNIWKVLIDDTHGVTPAEGLNYTIFIRNHGTEAEEIIAPVESNPAAAAHAVGTQLINDGDLYEVTTAIAVGDSLVAYPTSGYNIKAADSITGQLKSVKSGLGTAAAKNFTTSVTSGSADLVTSGAVYSAVDTLNTALTNQVLYFTSVACSATTGNFLTKSDVNITADHVVAECVFANPSAITTDVTWTTASGSVTLNGTCASATTANLVLVKKGN